jgi:hypothetical protein
MPKQNAKLIRSKKSTNSVTAEAEKSPLIGPSAAACDAEIPRESLDNQVWKVYKSSQK